MRRKRKTSQNTIQLIGTEHKIIELEEGWATVQIGITKLQGILEGGVGQFSSEEYMKLYTNIYTMCIQKAPHAYAQQLYYKYKEVFEEYVNSTVSPSIREKHDQFILRELVKRWSNHKIMVKWLSHFFNYLDRYFVLQWGLPDLSEVGLTSFRDMFYADVKIKARDAVIVLIDKEREGEQIDRALLKNVLDIFVEIGKGNMERYEEDFEKHMLLDTGAYYSRKASNWILDVSCADYMLKAEECLKKERDRASHYLHLSSEPKLVKKVHHELLVIYANQLLEKEHSGCHALLRDDKLDDLSRMYRLYHKIPRGLESVSTTFKQHITAEGTVLMQHAEEAASNQSARGDAQKWVLIRRIMKLHDKYMVHVNNCFQNHTLFHKALKEAFEVLCSKTVAGSSSAELLATFCDHILKKGGSENLSDEAIEETLEKVVRLLAYISDKDIFAEFYRKRLSFHLILERTFCIYHERKILTKLRQQCGGQLTSKMEGMVRDVTLSKENQVNFNHHLLCHPNAHPGIDMSVTVLTTGFWPSYVSADLNLPAEMVRAIQIFEEFFKQKSRHRKLTWIYSLGSCLINVKFEQKTIDLIVSTYQAAILLLFSSSDRLSFSEIMTQTNLAHGDLNRLLHSLSCTKNKILTKEPNSRTVSQADYFEFNHKFTDEGSRIKIHFPPVAFLPVDETKKVIEDVNKRRQYTIDAVIVRIMKSRKVLDLQHLVSECVEQLSSSFKPDIKAIKKRIEDLIARDYLERDKKNPNKFSYVA